MIALIVAAGACVLASSSAKRRPDRECSRLWTTSPSRSRRVRTGVLTACSVCRLIVSGLGYVSTRPSGHSSVRSSDRKRYGPVSRTFRHVVVLPVSVRAVMRNASSPAAMHAACTSA